MSDPKIKVYVEPRDWWVGYYRSARHHYVCFFPTLVIRVRRNQKGSHRKG